MAKIYMLAFVSMLFFLMGMVMLFDNQAAGWMVAIVFGFGFVVSLIQCIPGAMLLTLSSRGFEVKSLFRKHLIAWQDVSGFRTGSLASKKTVVFEWRKKSRWTSIQKLLSNGQGKLPSNYGLQPEELRDILNTWRDKHKNKGPLKWDKPI